MFVNILCSYTELLVGVLTSLQECILKLLSICLSAHIQGDRKVSVHLTITVQKTHKNTVF
jgi:hypothetical protein